MRRCEFCDSPVPADATVCPICKQEIAEETLERILPFLKRPETPDIHMTGTFGRLWGVIRRPATTYRDISKRPDMVGPVIIVLFNAIIMAGIFLAISSKFNVRHMVNATLVTSNVLVSPFSGYFYLAAIFGIFVNILLGLLYLIGGSLFAHLAFKVTGGTGRIGKTASIIGYSMIPVLLVRTLAIIVILIVMPIYDITEPALWQSIITEIYLSPAWSIIDSMTVMAFIWVGLLLVFGIREAHETSTLWAAIVSIACMIVLYWTFWQVH